MVNQRRKAKTVRRRRGGNPKKIFGSLRRSMNKRKKNITKKINKKKKRVNKSLNNWNKKVSAMYKQLKKKDSKATLADAMKAASKEKKSKSKSKSRLLSFSVD